MVCPARIILDVDEPYPCTKHHNSSFVVGLLPMIRLTHRVSHLRVEFHASGTFRKAVVDLNKFIAPDGALAMYNEYTGAVVVEGVYPRMLIPNVKPLRVRLRELFDGHKLMIGIAVEADSKQAFWEICEIAQQGGLVLRLADFAPELGVSPYKHLSMFLEWFNQTNEVHSAQYHDRSANE
ncbi:hypothetical protein E8E11_000496 [Didymella keratinophila]|nr:hypothetical protein E8E11_000496 [Didymella keratinophila]